MRWRLAFVLALGGALAAIAPDVRAEGGAQATFALIIGSNVSVDADLPPLKYADDDAANYLDLFRLIGARTYLLSRLDDNTRRLHPQAAAEALEPSRASLERAVSQIVEDVSLARERGVEAVFYVVYAGHGGTADGEGYVTLEDTRITGGDLARLVARVPATQVHVVVDACSSYYLAYSRGPGGERRPIHGFQDSAELAGDPRVGLLLSTSSARESHEWEGFQGGVFSHEVRSGLYGAADADGDGRVSYREIAAFVRRANELIPNERFRPNLHARPPQRSDTLLDIRRGLQRRLEIDGAHAAHYFIEDDRGVRLVDFHNDDPRGVRILRPPPNGPIYVRRADNDAEYVVPIAPEVVSLSDIEAGRARVASRGAANDAYNMLFSLPFDGDVVATYQPLQAPPDGAPTPDTTLAPAGPSASTRRWLGWSALGLGATGVGAGVALGVSASSTARDTTRTDSQRDVAQRNTRIGAYDTGAAVAYAAGGAMIATGLVLLLWPDSHVRVVTTPGATLIGYGGSF